MPARGWLVEDREQQQQRQQQHQEATSAPNHTLAFDRGELEYLRNLLPEGEPAHEGRQQPDGGDGDGPRPHPPR